MKAHFAYFAMFGATIVTAVACGARSGLDAPQPPTHDAGVDAGPDVVDAPPDAPPDALPDVVTPNDCADAGVTYIYVITEENDLYGYYPPTGTFHYVGQIDCPAKAMNTPFSMAVDRKGTAYVVFNPAGELFQVSTANASCKATSFLPQQNGFTATYGMGFSANLDGGDTLYLASDSTGANVERLGILDPQTFDLSVVAPFSKVIGNAELTGTGDAKLYGFGVQSPNIHLAQIDKTTASIIDDTPLQLAGGNNVVAWAFAFWGGDFYFFTSTQLGSSVVSKYTPGGSTTTVQVAGLDRTIVGAGVSTCAPQQ